MLPPVWVDATKLENVSQYANTRWGIVTAKFLKTKHLSNSTAYGITTLLFVSWDKRL